MSHVQFGLIVLKEGKALAQGLPFVMSWLAYSCRCDRYILRLTSIIIYSGSHSSLWLVTGSFLHPNVLVTSSCTYITHPFLFKEITMGQNFCLLVSGLYISDCSWKEAEGAFEIIWGCVLTSVDWGRVATCLTSVL